MPVPSHVGRTRTGRSVAAAFAVSLAAASGCGSRDGRDTKMDEIDAHLAAIATLVREMPAAPPAAAREKARAAEVHLSGIWAAVEVLKQSFKALPPTNAQAKRFGEFVDRIDAAGNQTIAALKRYAPRRDRPRRGSSRRPSPPRVGERIAKKSGRWAGGGGR